MVMASQVDVLKPRHIFFRQGQALVFLVALSAFSEAAELRVPIGATLQIPGNAVLQLGCADLSTAGSALVNSGLIHQAGDVNIAATGALHGGSGTIQVGGNWNNSGTFIAGSGTVMFVDDCTSTSASLVGDTQFNNLILTSQIGRTFVIEAGRNIGVSGLLTIQGTPGSPVSLVSSSQTGQVAYITLSPGASSTVSDARIPPNVRIVDSSPPPNPIPTLGVGSRYLMIFLLLLGMTISRTLLTSNPTRP